MQTCALPHARLLSADRRHPERGQHAAGGDPGDAAGHAAPSARAASSITIRPARWRRRSRKGTSDGTQHRRSSDQDILTYLQTHETQEPAALHHLRQRGRRQEHADRPAAVRIQAGLSRTSWPRSKPTRRRWARRAMTSTWRCWWMAWPPSASRASPSTWPTASSPPTGASSSSPTRPGHEQYTRNMVTGASTAELAIILHRCAQGRADPDAPPQLHRVAAGHPARGPRHRLHRRRSRRTPPGRGRCSSVSSRSSTMRIRSLVGRHGHARARSCPSCRRSSGKYSSVSDSPCRSSPTGSASTRSRSTASFRSTPSSTSRRAGSRSASAGRSAATWRARPASRGSSRTTWASASGRRRPTGGSPSSGPTASACATRGRRCS